MPTQELQDLVLGLINERCHDGAPYCYVLMFSSDINGDGRPEYFVAYTGGSGGAWILIVGGSPPKLLGEIFADLLVFKKQKHRWPKLVALSRSGCDTAYLATYQFSGDGYELAEEHVLHDYDACAYGEITNYRRKAGPPNCGKSKAKG